MFTRISYSLLLHVFKNARAADEIYVCTCVRDACVCICVCTCISDARVYKRCHNEDVCACVSLCVCVCVCV